MLLKEKELREVTNVVQKSATCKRTNQPYDSKESQKEQKEIMIQPRLELGTFRVCHRM